MLLIKFWTKKASVRYDRLGGLEMAIGAPDLNAPSLPEYFRHLVRGAIDRQKGRGNIQAPEEVEFYLVNLLQDCLSTHQLYKTPTEGFREEPLAFIYIRAIQADAEARAGLLKRLGDFSLFISGFFPESLTRRLVDVAYYIQMGETAYGSLSQLTARRSALSQIFGELSNHFVTYVDVLSEVSEKSAVQKDTDLLRLYELWLKTGSERAARLLSREGILPLPRNTFGNVPN